MKPITSTTKGVSKVPPIHSYIVETETRLSEFYDNLKRFLDGDESFEEIKPLVLTIHPSLIVQSHVEDIEEEDTDFDYSFRYDLSFKGLMEYIGDCKTLKELQRPFPDSIAIYNVVGYKDIFRVTFNLYIEYKMTSTRGIYEARWNGDDEVEHINRKRLKEIFFIPISVSFPNGEKGYAKVEVSLHKLRDVLKHRTELERYNYIEHMEHFFRGDIVSSIKTTFDRLFLKFN